MSEPKLPSASIENDFLRLEYLTTTGPRIVGLFAKGVDGNLLAETPDVHWETPHGEYHLHGGHRLWTAPEDPFYTCPENGLDVIEIADGVVLKSPVDVSRLQKEISIRLDDSRVHLSHRVTWYGKEPIEIAPWGITQLRLGGMAVMPQAKIEGLLPDRNLVLWPYTRIHEDRLDLQDDLVLLYGKAKGNVACKIGNENRHGWIAYILEDALFIKRFTQVAGGNYPDMGCNVEAYVKDACLELETLGELKKLDPSESISHEEIWEVHRGDYSLNLEFARKIKEKLSN